jgi:hypothetical protein
MNEWINEYQRFDSPDDKATCGSAADLVAALVIPWCSVNSELGGNVEQQRSVQGRGHQEWGWALRSGAMGAW